MQFRAMALAALACVLAAGPLAAQRADSITALAAEKIGGRDATVVIEEYSDFQCPYCAAHEMQFADAVQNWVLQQKGAVRFEFYDVALPQHLQAHAAAHAARCAGAQGRYAPARHAIFASQKEWAGAPDGSERVVGVARAVVKDTAKFNTCVARNGWRTDRILTANLQRAHELNVPGTPTFLIFAGERVGQIVDPTTPDSMAALVKSLQARH